MVKITKLPPGEAIGARDLQKWAHRRSIGYSGVHEPTQKYKKSQRLAKQRRARWQKRQAEELQKWIESAHEPFLKPHREMVQEKRAEGKDLLRLRAETAKRHQQRLDKARNIDK